jgi:hypothetical protein
LKSYLYASFTSIIRNNLYLINWVLSELITLQFLVSSDQPPLLERQLDQRVGSGVEGKVTGLFEAPRAFVAELGMELGLVEHLEDRLFEQRGAQCRLGSEQREQPYFQ